MKTRTRAAGLLGLVLFVAGCETMGPSITSAFVAFGRELLGRASVNYAEDYARSVNQILLALAEVATGQPFTQPVAYQGGAPYGQGGAPYGQGGGSSGNQSGGYYGNQSNNPYANQSQQGGYYGSTPNDPYAGQHQGGYQGNQTNDPYANQAQGGYDGGQASDPYASQSQQGGYYGSTPNDPYAGQHQGGYQGNQTNDPYANQTQGGYDGGQASDPYASQSQQGGYYGSTPNDPYAGQHQGGYQGNQTNDPYANQAQGGYYGTRGIGGALQPTLKVAILAQTITSSGNVALRPVQDGEVLRDGGSNPAAGDKIKLEVEANCTCFLYVIGIDATGWVTQIRPEPREAITPLTADRAYLLPDGNEWWGLDNYKGVEHLYFVLSRGRRPDLEAALLQLPTERPNPPATYQPVSDPALVATRGLVKVKSEAPVRIPGSQGMAQTVSADAFSSELAGADLVITRWFRHE